MAEAAPALPAATLELINTRAINHYNEFKQNATPEQKTARKARYQRYREDPEFMAEQMVKVGKMFSEADVNGDGRLNLAEYRSFQTAIKADAANAGEWIEADDHDEENYSFLNAVDAEDGFTMEQMQQVLGPWMAKFKELETADAQ